MCVNHMVCGTNITFYAVKGFSIQEKNMHTVCMQQRPSHLLFGSRNSYCYVPSGLKLRFNKSENAEYVMYYDVCVSLG